MDCNSSENKKYFEELAKIRAYGLSNIQKTAPKNVGAYIIYDLLQNADNAQATYAIFELYKDKLVFKHNGKKHFTISNPANEENDLKNQKLGDVNAITSVTNFNQKERKIGHIGFGIRSVMIYTPTILIYDTNFCFKIEHYVIPTLLTEDYDGRKKDETIFVISFQNPIQSFNEIQKRLQNMVYPNLFLTNLISISYMIENQTSGQIERKVELEMNYADIKVEFTSYLHQKDDNLLNQRFWIFSHFVKNFPISIAFQVGNDGFLKPISDTKAFCFFQTNEKTYLNFFINAPFLLSIENDQIKPKEPHNLLMINELANLSAKSLLIFKDIGFKYNVQLINDNILSIIPISSIKIKDSQEQISFSPFYNEIKKIFLTEEIIPTENGFVSKKNAYWTSDQAILDLFTNEQLTLLVKNPNAKWVLKTFISSLHLQNDFIDSIVELVIDDHTLFNAIKPDVSLPYGSLFPNDSKVKSFPVFKDCFDLFSDSDDLNPFSSFEAPPALPSNWGTNGNIHDTGPAILGSSLGGTWGTNGNKFGTAQSSVWSQSSGTWGTNGNKFGTGQSSVWSQSSGTWGTNGNKLGTGQNKMTENSTSKKNKQDKTNAFKGISIEFIEKQSFDWLNSFYKWINLSSSRIKMAKTVPIFLDVNKKVVSAFNPNNELQLFFPLFTKADQNYSTVNPIFLKDEQIFNFMRNIGISLPLYIKNHIYNTILPNWTGNNQTDFKKIIFYSQFCSFEERKLLIEKLQNTDLLLFTTKANKEIQKGKPETLYFPNQILVDYFEPLPQTRFICIDKYKDICGPNKNQEITQLFILLGVRNEISVVECSVEYSDLNKYEINLPYATRNLGFKELRIDGFDAVLNAIKKDHSKSITLWNVLLQFSKNDALKQFCESKYEYYFRQDQSLKYPSIFRKKLIHEKWLVTSTNELVSPDEVFLIELPKEYNIDDPAVPALADFLNIKRRNVELLTSEYISDHDFVNRIKKAGLFEKFTRELIEKEAKSKK